MSAIPRPGQILLVGHKIRQIRKSRRLTQADVASRIGVTQSDLSRMENGEYKVGLDTLFKILQVFELPLSRFFEESAGGDEPSGALPALPGLAAQRPEVAVVPEPVHAVGDAPNEAQQAQQRLLAEWSELNEDARDEVMEFISFKKMQQRMQQRSLRPHWKSDAEEERVPAPSVPAAHAVPAPASVDRGPWGQVERMKGTGSRRTGLPGQDPEGGQHDA